MSEGVCARPGRFRWAARALGVGLAGVLLGCRAPRLEGSADRTPFNWLVGDWQGRRRNPDSDSSAPLQVQVRSILGGRGQSEELSLAADAGTAHACILRIPGAQPARWIAIEVDDARVGHSVADGIVTGTTSTWTTRSANPQEIVLTTFERLGPGAWQRTSQVSYDGGETWRLLWIDELQR